MLARKRQIGATLITALIMLIVLTLLVVSGIRASNTNLRIVGNMQMQEEAVAAVQQAIEKAVSTPVFDVSAQTVGSYTVRFSPPICQSSRPTVKGDANLPEICEGSVGTTSCYWTTWDIAASAVDASTGATAEIHQGIQKIAGSTEANAANCGQ